VSKAGAQAGTTPGKPPVWRDLVRSPQALVVGSLLLSYFLLWPVGHFAVDDEWAFLKSLQHLDVEGRIRISPWNPMSLLSHLYWGLLFTKLGGFSFTAARLSTVVMFGVLGLSVAALLRRIGVSRRTTGLALLALMFNPLCLFHGFLYMTDVPACAWTVLAALLMVKGLEGQGRRAQWWLLAGSLCGALGFLVRQSGLLVHIALIVFLLLYDRRRLLTPAGFIACFVLPALTTAGFQYWYHFVHGPTIMFREESRQVLASLRHPKADELSLAIFQYGVYIGLFVLPLLVALPLGFWRLLTGRKLAALASVVGLSALAIAVQAARQHLIFPYLPNKLTQFGFLSLNEVIVGDRPLLWGHAVAWAVTIVLALALIGFVGVLLQKGAEVLRPPAPAALRFVAVLGALQFFYLLVTVRIVFDRHLLMVLPTALLLVAGLTRDLTMNRAAPGLVLAFLALYGLAGTHDVYALSRAAFKAGDSLLARGVTPMSIEGGYAFDGWYTFEAWQQEKIHRARKSDPWWVQALMQGIDSRWLLSLSPSIDEQAYNESRRPWTAPNPPEIRGYHTVNTVPYSAWLPPGKRELFVLERQ
jgi:4-amino-4-deoxy-L-arabinose transferase-like glycosyltransferase